MIIMMKQMKKISQHAPPLSYSNSHPIIASGAHAYLDLASRAQARSITIVVILDWEKE